MILVVNKNNDNNPIDDIILLDVVNMIINDAAKELSNSFKDKSNEFILNNYLKDDGTVKLNIDKYMELSDDVKLNFRYITQCIFSAYSIDNDSRRVGIILEMSFNPVEKYIKLNFSPMSVLDVINNVDNFDIKIA